MCEHGTTIPVEVTVVARLAHAGMDVRKTKPIDACIAPLVAALDAGGVRMLGSCCGHGARPGSILLDDGREIRILAGDQ